MNEYESLGLNQLVSTFYTYLYLRYDGTPYYVGKGKGYRAIERGKKHLVPVPKDPARILIQEFPTEFDAFAAERFLISYYGRKDLGTGILRNLLDGGTGGTSGAIVSEETRKKIGNAHRGKVLSKKTRQRIRAAHIGKVLSIETRTKISIARKGNRRCIGRVPWNKGKSGIYSPEYRQNISNAKKGIVPSEETKRKLSIAGMGRIVSIETRKKLSAALTGRMFSAEWRKNISDAKKGHTPWNKGRQKENAGYTQLQQSD